MITWRFLTCLWWNVVVVVWCETYRIDKTSRWPIYASQIKGFFQWCISKHRTRAPGALPFQPIENSYFYVLSVFLVSSHAFAMLAGSELKIVRKKNHYGKGISISNLAAPLLIRGSSAAPSGIP